MTSPNSQPTAALQDWLDDVSLEGSARETAEQRLKHTSDELHKAKSALETAKSTLERKLFELENERDRALMLSRTDLLTRIANRSAIVQEFESKFSYGAQPGKEIWFFLLDICGFKHLNSSFGQSVGDEVLIRLARRLEQAAAPHRGVAARFSGKEFALLVELDAGTAAEFSEQLWTTMHVPIRIGRRDIQVSVTIGGVGTNLEFDSVDAMRNAADYALTCARSHAIDHAVLFDAKLQRDIVQRQELETLLRHAVNRYKIEPWFQPIIYPQDPDAISLEVLARWPETQGLVSPSEFLPIAEQIGIRRELDRWLIRLALQRAKDWVLGGKVKDISINVPPNDLMSQSFVDELEEVLTDTAYPRDRLVVEITESVFIEDLSLVNDQLEKLSALGVRIALDDFGTGYSNLRSLVGLPLSKIKLDKSLIADMESNHRVAMLVSTFIQWARASDLSIVAEGVETESQASLLKALGCTSLQGFLYGRAMEASDVEEHWKTGQPFKV